MACEVTDELLRSLVQEWVAALPEQYPASERPRHFSLRFHRRMRPLLRRAKRKEAPSALFRGGRFAAALLAAALLTATVAMAFPAVRERVFRMVWERHEDYTRLYYEEVTGDGTSAEGAAEEQEFMLYRFSYVPEGFTLEDYTFTDTLHHEAFFNEEGLAISLDQERLEESGPVEMTGEIEPEEVFLNSGQTAWYVDRPLLKSIHWNDGVYAFGVTTHLSREETIRIAESLVPVEEPFADVTFTPYDAAYLPEGFSMAEFRTEKGSHRLRYEDAQGGALVLDQIWWDRDAFADDFGNDQPSYLFILGSQEVRLLEKPDSRSLCWDWGEYSFRLSSDVLPAEELTKVAVNLHPAGKEAEVLSPYHLTCIPEGFEQAGNGYSGGTHYEDFYKYDRDAEYGGVYQEDTRKIDFYQERLGETRCAIDPDGLEPTSFTLEGGRTVWVLADPPEERTLWTQYSYALWWEDGEYLLSLWSSLPWEETAKIAEGILKM